MKLMPNGSLVDVLHRVKEGESKTMPQNCAELAFALNLVGDAHLPLHMLRFSYRYRAMVWLQILDT
jgi:hypothetical protein